MTAKLVQKRIRGLNTGWWVSGNESPDAPIAVLFHGFPDAPDTWNSQLPLLEKDFLVVRPLLRGAGESEPTKESRRYGRESLLLDHLEILRTVSSDESRRVIVFGHDIGSVSAWELANALGTRAMGLVLVAGMGLEVFWNRRFQISQHRKSWYMYLMQVPRLPEAAFQWFGAGIVRRAYQSGGIQPPSDQWEKLQPNVVGMIEHYRAGLSDAIHSTPSEHRLKCPTLVLWGDKDPYLAQVTEAEWKRVASDVEIRVLKAGHWLHQEIAEVVNQKVGQFMERL